MDSVDELVKKFAGRVGYSASDLENFSENDPRARLINRMPDAFKRYSIVAEVVQSRHCNTGYQVGDRFVLDADGNFITKLCPKKMCVYAISQLIVPVALINERFSEGLAPDDFHFMHHVRCLDTGVECMGYGGIMLKVSAVSRE